MQIFLWQMLGPWSNSYAPCFYAKMLEARNFNVVKTEKNVKETAKFRSFCNSSTALSLSLTIVESADLSDIDPLRRAWIGSFQKCGLTLSLLSTILRSLMKPPC